MEVTITRAAAVMKKWEPLTVGMSKAVPIRMTLSDDWANLAKVAVFRAGTTVIDVLDSSWPAEDMCYVPPEVLTVAGARVEFGLYGTNADDAVVIPTIWVNLGRVQTAPDPDGDPTTDPTLPVWAQIQAEMIDSMEINSAGHLIVTYHDGDTDDLGSVIGPQGETGPEGPEGPEGPPGSLGIYIATYGVTTSAEIEAAYQAGKFLLCKQTSNGLDFYYAFTRRQNSTIHDFGLCFWGNTAPTIRAVYCQNDSWHGYARDVAVLNSPAFGGTPTAPTADPGTDSTQIATTAFVQDAIRGIENQLVPSGGASGYVLKKASSDNFDLEWAAESGGGGADNIYVATYGTTTSAEIEAAYQAGKQIFVEQGGRIMRMTYRYNSSTHCFGCVYRDVVSTINACICKNNVWSGWRRNVADLDDIAPTFDITANYTAGQYVIHDGDLYRFTSNHAAGAWDDNDATAVVLSEEVGGKLDKTGGTMSGAIAMGSNRITGLADGVSDNDAVNVAQMSSAISQSTAFFRGSFATNAALLAVAWQTSDPEASYYVTNNDYAVVLDDETQNDECWRYIYVTGSGWTAQYKINETPLTQAQLDALNSGATAANIGQIATNTTAISGKISAPQNPTVGDFLVYTSNGWGAMSLSTWQGGSY